MNLFSKFRSLLPKPVLQVGNVVAVSDGVCTIELPHGSLVTARGEANSGDRVYFRDGVIEGPAPDLPYVEYDI